MAGKSKGEEDKTLTNSQKLENIGTEAAKGVTDATKTYTDELKNNETERHDNAEANIKNLETANADYVGDINKAYDSIYGKEGLLQGIYDEQQEAALKRQEDYIKQTERDRRAAQWVGITEVAAGIANAIGVAHGASNQQISPVSKDWMQKAEANEKTRKQHLDQLAENLRARREQMAQGKLQGLLAALQADHTGKTNVFNLKLNEGNTSAANKDKQAEVGYKGAVSAVNTTASAKQGAVEMGQRESAQKENAAIAWGRINASNTKSGSGSGSSKDIKVVVGDKRYHIDENSLVATISANTDLISAEDMEAISGVLGDETKSADERAMKLLPYMKKYPELEQAIGRASTYVDEYTDKPEDKEKEKGDGAATSTSDTPLLDSVRVD